MATKMAGQTDGRILDLSPEDFEQEFGFRPEDDVEQRYFATHGQRLLDPESRKRAEMQQELRQKALERRAQP